MMQRFKIGLLVGLISCTVSTEPQRRPPPEDELTRLISYLSATWTAEGTQDQCARLGQTFSFIEDGRAMLITFPKPTQIYDGSTQVQVRYTVEGPVLDGNQVQTLRVKMDGEKRLTETGAPAVWDMVPDKVGGFCWRRTDWPLSRCNPPRVRCGSREEPINDNKPTDHSVGSK
jgi:hypothetical protein